MVAAGMCASITLPRFPITVTHDFIRTLKRSMSIRSPTMVGVRVVGGVYIHEPGFPDEWNKAPFTCDWGRAGLFRHTVEPLGATFKEAAAPQKFIKVSRPTDADVDGMSAVYQAAWKGPATFNWAGPDQGYIVRVTPKGYTPEPLPDFEKMSDEALVEALNSSSHIRTLAAQRTLLRRADSIELTESLGKLSCDTDKALSARIAAIFTMSLRSPESGALMALVAGRTLPEIQPFLIRAYGEVRHPISVDRCLGSFYEKFRKRALHEKSLRQSLRFLSSMRNRDPLKRLFSSQNIFPPQTPSSATLPYRALAKMSAHEAAFSKVNSDDTETRKAAAWALMRMHKKEVVDGLLVRLKSENIPEKRRPLLSTLARLYHKEAEWKGDSWGTRPDTRGPYYELATWEESGRILENLKASPERCSRRGGGLYYHQTKQESYSSE
jgi:hypothetical protein